MLIWNKNTNIYVISVSYPCLTRTDIEVRIIGERMVQSQIKNVGHLINMVILTQTRLKKNAVQAQ